MTSIDIELERPSGVYYAGEVVRGTVKLNCSSKVTCRGFNIQLAATARVHWHTGSGDNRNDYYGDTIFQDQRLTAVGKFYKTGFLDDAGADAIFDDIHNSGIIQIPATSMERDNMKLIVRAMDYDWGKKDDLLGEILLDVPQLVQGRQKQSFPLTRNGKPEKGEITLSARWLPYDAIFPTESCTGVAVSLSVKKEYCLILQIHQATGLRRADWIGRNDVYVQVYRPEDAKDNISPGTKLPGPNKEIELPVNEEIVAPFAFLLRKDAPGSAELHLGDYSHLRYKLRAYIDLAHWKDPSSKRIITVIPNRPIPRMDILSPYQASVGPEPMYQYSCCCNCCSAGEVSVELKVDRLAFAAGEALDLSGSRIVNDSNQPLNVKVGLMTTGILKCRSRSTTCHHQFDLAHLPSKVLPGQTLQITSGMVNAQIPPVPPSFSGGVRNPTRTHYDCLKWTYSLNLMAFTDTTCSGWVQAVLPVLVSCVPPYEHVLRDLKEQHPKSCNITLWQIFEHAYNDANEGATTAPTISGAEDGGYTVYAGSAISTKETGDNNLVSGMEAYQPVVNAFDGPITLSSIEGNNTASAGGEDHQTLVDELLQSMDDAYDKRLAVGTWVRDHPQAALGLRPIDFANILRKVTFSLDQSSVVGELVSAFEGSNKLMCAHIVSTMEVCQYQKMEVAMLMVPHASDPESKRAVLDMLDYSFDKKDVSDAFRGTLV